MIRRDLPGRFGLNRHLHVADSSTSKKIGSTPFGSITVPLSAFGDVEDLLAERGIVVSYEAIDILVTRRRDNRAAKRFFCKALKRQGRVPWQLDKTRLTEATI